MKDLAKHFIYQYTNGFSPYYTENIKDGCYRIVNYTKDDSNEKLTIIYQYKSVDKIIYNSKTCDEFVFTQNVSTYNNYLVEMERGE